MSGLQSTFFPDVPSLFRRASKDTLQEISFTSALTRDGRAVQYVLLYFAASWCPDCRAFSPMLETFYQSSHVAKDFEIIFVPCNKDAQQYTQDALAAPWLSTPYLPKVTERIGKELKVNSIPGMVVIEAATGAVVCGMNAAEKLEQDPQGRHFPWTS